MDTKEYFIKEGIEFAKTLFNQGVKRDEERLSGIKVKLNKLFDELEEEKKVLFSPKIQEKYSFYLENYDELNDIQREHFKVINEQRKEVNNDIINCIKTQDDISRNTILNRFIENFAKGLPVAIAIGGIAFYGVSQVKNVLNNEEDDDMNLIESDNM